MGWSGPSPRMAGVLLRTRDWDTRAPRMPAHRGWWVEMGTSVPRRQALGGQPCWHLVLNFGHLDYESQASAAQAVVVAFAVAAGARRVGVRWPECSAPSEARPPFGDLLRKAVSQDCLLRPVSLIGQRGRPSVAWPGRMLLPPSLPPELLGCHGDSLWS